MKQHEIEQVEIDLLLEALFRRYGYDFRSYARASIERRIRLFMSQRSIDHVGELIPLVLRDEEVFSALAQQFSIAVTELFRDPPVYLALREKVVPFLRSYPFLKVWHAGCATGEEVYSLAIVLAESSLLDRTTLFGTDFNDDALERARKGLYAVERIKEATRGYQEAGGARSFSEYYHASYDSVSMSKRLRERITFANHNLAVDQVFGEMHLVVCRNVMIYFDKELQNRVLRLIDDSLVRGGFLCLGTGEDLLFSEVADRFEVVDRAARIYKKRVQ